MDPGDGGHYGITGFASDALWWKTAAANGTDGFANDLAGGSFSVVQSGNSLNLVFSPVPEPSVLVLGLAAGLAVAPLVVRSRFRIAPRPARSMAPPQALLDGEQPVSRGPVPR